MARKKHLNLNQFQLHYEDSPYYDYDGGVEGAGSATRSPMETTIRAYPNDNGRYSTDEALGTLTVRNTESYLPSDDKRPALYKGENQIMSIDVDPEHRGKGVGSALLGSLMNAHKENKLIGSTQTPLSSYKEYNEGDKAENLTDLTPEQKAFVDRRLKNY